MKKTRRIIFILLLCGMLLSVTGSAAASNTAGSADDPLVAQSWVDAYVDSSFMPLEKEVSALRKALVESLSSVNIELTINSNSCLLNGKSTQIDSDNSAVVPYINNDERTMVPIRFVAESLGAQVTWNANTRSATIKNNDTTVVMTIGSTVYYVNNSAKTMNTAPTINQGWNRTMVPIRFISEALGCSVDWSPKNGATKTVYIVK